MDLQPECWSNSTIVILQTRTLSRPLRLTRPVHVPYRGKASDKYSWWEHVQPGTRRETHQAAVWGKVCFNCGTSDSRTDKHLFSLRRAIESGANLLAEGFLFAVAAKGEKMFVKKGRKTARRCWWPARGVEGTSREVREFIRRITRGREGRTGEVGFNFPLIIFNLKDEIADDSFAKQDSWTRAHRWKSCWDRYARWMESGPATTNNSSRACGTFRICIWITFNGGFVDFATQSVETSQDNWGSLQV